ncbi:hypothetical protein NL108_009579 [Boleophthalmus pectinirostris]|nr:hypothetical protein NL108_009579 [Boleophthalmus pectinirostris]
MHLNPRGPWVEQSKNHHQKRCLSCSWSQNQRMKPQTMNALERYKAESSVRTHVLGVVEWWSAHSGAYSKMAHFAQKYLLPLSPLSLVKDLFHWQATLYKKRSAVSSENVKKLVPKQLVKGRVNADMYECTLTCFMFSVMFNFVSMYMSLLFFALLRIFLLHCSHVLSRYLT